MADRMTFPKTADDFIKQYSFKDEKQEYTNGAELISVFRVKQMMEHYFPEEEVRCKDGKHDCCEDCEFGENRDACIAYLKESMADHLIANGVTVQQWIPVTERLPKEEDADEHDCVLVHTSNRDNLIVAREAVWKCTEFVTHWQPLHEPPKGE